MEYKDKKIYLNGRHIGYIDFSFYEDIKALGFGKFEIIDKRKGYGTLVVKDIIQKYKDKYDLIYCFVDKENVGAIKFYRKVGKVRIDIVNEKGQYQVILYKKEDNIVNTPTTQCETYSQNDMVIISKERYNRLKSLYDEIWNSYYDGENNAKVYYENIKIPQERKETAEKILNTEFFIFETENRSEEYQKGYMQAVRECRSRRDELAKQFGVEIKE